MAHGDLSTHGLQVSATSAKAGQGRRYWHAWMRKPSGVAAQMRAVPSRLAVARWRPSGEKAALVTRSRWPGRMARSSPVFVSQNRAVLSSLAVTTRVPSGENDAAHTRRVWPWSVASGLPPFTSAAPRARDVGSACPTCHVDLARLLREERSAPSLRARYCRTCRAVEHPTATGSSSVTDATTSTSVGHEPHQIPRPA